MDEFHSDRFKLDSLIGEGNFGSVYKALDSTTKKYVAIKIEKPCKVSQLDIETEVLDKLSGEKGFPKLIAYGKSGDKKFMAMSLLGQNLQKKMILMRKMISLDIVLEIGTQCLQRIQTLHEHFYIHRDLKPQQYLVDNDLNVSLVDFGLSKKYLNKKMMIHIPYTDNRPFVGTVNYASLNTHLGIQQSRRDDLESFCYILSYLIKGKLPWISTTKKFTEKEIKKLKASLTPSALFNSGFLVQLFSYIKTLQFEKTPDYAYLFELINKAMADEQSKTLSRETVNEVSLCSSKSTKKIRKPKKRKRTLLKRSNFCRTLDDIVITLEDNSKTEVCENLPEIKDRGIIAEKYLQAAECQIVKEKMNCLIT